MRATYQGKPYTAVFIDGYWLATHLLSFVPHKPLCSTCKERQSYCKGECTTCYMYRYRFGKQRPGRLYGNP